jgi:hypothetical protein
VNACFKYSSKKTVTSPVHCWFTDDFVETLIESQIMEFWLQQDSVTAHTVMGSKKILKDFFIDQMNSSSTYQPWLSGLTPPHFILYEVLKHCTYATQYDDTTIISAKHHQCQKQHLKRNFKTCISKCTQGPSMLRGQRSIVSTPFITLNWHWSMLIFSHVCRCLLVSCSLYDQPVLYN